MRFCLLSLAVAILLPCGCRKEKPGPKTDAQRMADAHKIAAVIELYRAKTGRYPYAENWEHVEPNMVAIPIAVFICSKPLPEDYRYPPAGRTGAVFPYEEFLAYLRKGLGKDLTLPEDDRDPYEWVPYQFAFDGKNYFVSAHLTQPNEFTRPVGRAHKYQVGSIGSAKAKVRAYADVR